MDDASPSAASHPLRHAMLALVYQPRTFESTAPTLVTRLIQPNARTFAFDVFVHTETSNSCQYACGRWNATRAWRAEELDAAVRAAYITGTSTIRRVHVTHGTKKVPPSRRWLEVLRAADAVRQYYDVYLFCRMDMELTASLQLSELLARGRAWRTRHVGLTGGSHAQREHDFLYCVTGTAYNVNSFIHRSDTDYFTAGSRRCVEALATAESTHDTATGTADGVEEARARWRAKISNVTVSKRTLDRWRNATGLKPDKPYLIHGDEYTRAYYRRQLVLLQEGCGFEVRTSEGMGVHAELVRPGGERQG